ncbi:MAG: DUF1573 domain-containing protein, partial [Planctomycetota bacterium]|nr:DUF1573 domain-containing protein [Planctomycetota bacterium]
MSLPEPAASPAQTVSAPVAAEQPNTASDLIPAEPSEPARPQSVAVSPGVLDFGTQSLMSRPTGEITLTNQGNKTVTLVAVSPTCSCLKPEFTDRVVLAPGANHTVAVAHEPRSQAGPSKATLRFVF